MATGLDAVLGRMFNVEQRGCDWRQAEELASAARGRAAAVLVNVKRDTMRAFR